MTNTKPRKTNNTREKFINGEYSGIATLLWLLVVIPIFLYIPNRTSLLEQLDASMAHGILYTIFAIGSVLIGIAFFQNIANRNNLVLTILISCILTIISFFVIYYLYIVAGFLLFY